MKTGVELEKERIERERSKPRDPTPLAKEQARMIEVRRSADRARKRIAVRAKRNGLLSWTISQRRANDFERKDRPE
jgi:hypothetical protein